jgi:hypothetical protein
VALLRVWNVDKPPAYIGPALIARKLCQLPRAPLPPVLGVQDKVLEHLEALRTQVGGYEVVEDDLPPEAAHVL